MKILRFIIVISIIALTGCGGGGGGSGPIITPTVVSGVACAGLISGGTVKVFALNTDGSVGVLLGQDITKAGGTYSVNLGSYIGAVTVEAYGSYTDEATGQIKTVSATAPLRAALGNANGNVTLAVTPLTDLAVRQAGTLNARNITAANASISGIFKVDIIATLPIEPTVSAFQASQTTLTQIDYTLTLAAISQQMQTSGTDLSTTLSNLNSGISSSGMNSQTAATILSAINNFIGSPANQTGITSISSSSLQAVGATTKILTISLQGNTASLVKGIQTIITFPAGVTLRANASGDIFAGVIATVMGSSNGMLSGKYTPATATAPASLNMGFITTGTLASGDVITISTDIAAGFSSPAISAFPITGTSLVDSNGINLSGTSVTIR